MLHAPFNFVPLSEEVFFPGWAEQISHDVPFKNSHSGIIKIKITAQTPIFIRNGHTRDDREFWSDEYKDFSHTPDNKFFIPATSIKGMVRNVLEIASFGKMSQITNKRYSLRDLHLKAFKTYFDNHPVHCGWMTLDNEKKEAIITDHGIPRRIAINEIDKMLGTKLEEFVKWGKITQTENRYAKAKYEKVKGKSLIGTFTDIPLNSSNKVDPRKKVRFDKNGEAGTIVFTGQPGQRKENPYGKSTGKWYEFVFLEKKLAEYTLDINEENGVYQDFCFIYEDSEDWKYWKSTKRKGRIPVFFTIDNNKIQYMGLSYLFKLPTKKHIREFLNEKHRSNKRDLAECIFGTTEKPMLKGRVQFSNAYCTTDTPNVCQEVYPYMGTPKPSYYPIYTQQRGTNGQKVENNKLILYKTFLDDDAKLRGWKRYPVREKEAAIPHGDDTQFPNTCPFRPLDSGTVFECMVRYHNLREEELGALMYSLSVMDNCLYSLGFCKPYGYGIVRLDITNVDKAEVQRLKESFLKLMDDKIKNYRNSPQIRELREMMSIAKDGLRAPLSYMSDPKQFAKLKNQNPKKGEFGEYQENYSLIKKKASKGSINDLVLEAKVTLFSGFMKKAQLTGKNAPSMLLDMNNSRDKLKVGQTIKVKIIKNGKEQKLLYLGK